MRVCLSFGFICGLGLFCFVVIHSDLFCLLRFVCFVAFRFGSFRFVLLYCVFFVTSLGFVSSSFLVVLIRLVSFRFRLLRFVLIRFVSFRFVSCRFDLFSWRSIATTLR